MKRNNFKKLILSGVMASVLLANTIIASAYSVDPPIINSPKCRILQMEKQQLRK